jgi:manganese-dependent inorganic pyrophosphatase
MHIYFGGEFMKDTIYIVGHRNPDTDSICSSIAYSELKKKLGYNATASRLGEINKETEYILNYFNIPVPDYLQTVKTQVSDLNIDRVIPVSPEVSIKTAWSLMKRNNVKTLPVADDYERLLGIATLSDITTKYMDTLENNIISASKTPLRNIIETLNGKIVCVTQEDFKTSGNVVVAAMSP